MTGGKSCEAVFPQGHWQFVHSIHFLTNSGAGGTVIGVISLNQDEIASALMTVEGFTLFAAVLSEGKGLEVQRAVAPFDKPAFAEGLMRDVQTIFFAPRAESMLYGQSADKEPVCRYTTSNGSIIDVLPTADGCWQIKTYTAALTLERSIVGRSCRKNDNSLIPESLKLKGFGQADYTLQMTLIDAEKLSR